MRNTVVFGCALLGGALSAGAANAQFFEFEARTSHAAFANGKPQTFTAAATQSNSQPTVVAPGQPVTVFSLGGFFANGAPANGIALPASGSINPILAQNPRVFLFPGAPARSGEIRLSIPTLSSAGEAFADFSDEGFDYEDDCARNAGFNNRVGVPAETTVRACDAIDSSLRLNGVSFQLMGLEDRVPLRLVIPAIGFDFTATPPATIGADPFVGRGDSFDVLEDALYATGKVPMLAAALLGTATAPAAGTLPDLGDLVRGEVTVGGVTKTFGLDNPGQLLAYVLVNRSSSFSDFGLNYDDGCFRPAPTGPVAGACSAASARVSIAGVEVTATSAANSPDVTFSAPALNLQFTSSGAIDRDDAGEQFAEFAADNVEDADLTRAYARFLAQTDPTNPLVGNPFSAQGQLTRLTLDLDTPSDALDENEEDGGASGARTRPDDPSGWMVGGRAGYLEAGGQGAEFVDVVAERGFRFREGSRARLKVSMPVSYIHYGGRNAGGETATLGLRGALELPLIDGRWVVEPSAAASAFYSSTEVSSGALYSLGLSSRYKIAPIGRGHLVIGNAVSYSSSLEIEAGSFATPKISNTAVRNGIAYQVPYGRFLGRQGTVRASYTFTHLFGDEVLVEDYHDVSLSYGVASREASVKQVNETLRLGVNGSFGKDFTAVSLTAGYRF